MKTTKFKSVAEAAANLAEDPEVASSVKKEIARNSLVSALLSMRIKRGLTQEDMAKAMNCAPSTVSRIESGNDRQLKWTDIVGYVKGLDVKMQIFFHDPSLPAAVRIKQCVFKIHEDLETLAALAKHVGGNDEIAQEIDRFYKQVLFNFLARFQAGYEKLNGVINIPASQNVNEESEFEERADSLLPQPTKP